MIPSGAEPDPFALLTDPDAYLPRPASEEALDELERAVLLKEAPVALFGPPGIGKTLLLRVLASRLEGSFRAVHLPYPLLAPDDLCRWALMLLDDPATEDPEAALLAAAGRGNERDLGVLLLIDDADALPLGTARRLFELAKASGGDLRIVLAAADHARAWRVYESSGDELAVVRFTQPMTEEETGAYLRAHLEGCDDATRARFDEAALRAVHEEAEGIPGVVHLVATAVLRGEPVPERRAAIHALADLEAEAGAPERDPVELPTEPEPRPAEPLAARLEPVPTPIEPRAETPPPAPTPTEAVAPEPEPIPMTPVATEPTPEPEPAPIAAFEPVAEEPAPVPVEVEPLETRPAPTRAQAEVEIAEVVAETAGVAEANGEAAELAVAERPVAEPLPEEPETRREAEPMAELEGQEVEAEPGAGRAFDVGQVASLRRRSRRRALLRREVGARHGRRSWLVAALLFGLAGLIAIPFVIGWPFGTDTPAVDVAAPPPQPLEPEPPAQRGVVEVPIRELRPTETKGVGTTPPLGPDAAAAPAPRAGKPAVPQVTAPGAVPAEATEGAPSEPDVAAVPPSTVEPELPALQPDAVAETPPVESAPPEPVAPEPTENLVAPKGEPDADASAGETTGQQSEPARPEEPKLAALPPSSVTPELPGADPDAAAETPRVESVPPGPVTGQPPARAAAETRPDEPMVEAAETVLARSERSAEPAPSQIARAPEPRRLVPPPMIPIDVEAPEGAAIEVDGRPLGVAPIRQFPVPEGRRRVRARLADGTVMQRTVDIGPDRTRVVFY